MLHLRELDELTRAMVLFGSMCAELEDEPWPRVIRTALSDWVLYPDDRLECLQAGDGAMTPEMV